MGFIDKATDKQRQYIGVLVDRLGWTSEQIAVYADEQRIDLANLTITTAGVLIDKLKKLQGGRA